MDENNATDGTRGRSLRKALAMGIVLIWLGMAGWAYIDVGSREAHARRDAGVRVTAAADVVELLFQADDARIDSELARLRTELRAEGAWSQEGIAFNGPQQDEGREGESEIGSEIVAPDRAAIDARRLEASLRRALVGAEQFARLELVIAGHDGLHIEAVERGEEAVHVRDFKPDERDGLAKALWYAEEVASAVSSAGRRVERGEIAFEGVIERPMTRAAIGIHNPGELVQAVLVASVDLSGLATRLSGLTAAGERLTLLSIDGRAFDPSARSEAERSRLSALTARVLEADDATTPFEVDGQIVLGRPLASPGGGLPTTIALIGSASIATGVSAWLATPWPIALLLLALVSVPAVLGLLGKRNASHSAPIASRSAGDSASAAEDEAPIDPIDVAPERVVLRDWLADIRGCLEREAATRGLALDLRCERSLPIELETDPGWLGGLIVAMGREALDATDEDRIRVEVLEDEGETLRFQIAAGAADLAPIAGMREVAQRMGGRLEAGAAGQLALVLPNALA